MTTLYYGNGKVSIEGSNIRGVQIKYRGAIEIIDNTSDNFAIANNANIILVFPIGEGFLNDLFSYNGRFKIISVIVVDNNADKVPTDIKKVMDYSELLGKSEDIVVNSEELASGHISGNRTNKTFLKAKIIPNLHTSNQSALYLKDETQYRGHFHIHLDAKMKAMTGNEHTDASQDLYYKKKDKLVSTKIVKQKKKKPKTKVVRSSTRKSVRSTEGGY